MFEVENSFLVKAIYKLENIKPPRFSRVPGSASPVTSLSLANEAQYLLLNSASGKALAHKIRSRYETQGLEADYNISEERIDVDKLIARFRGNIVVDGATSFDEDEWQEVRIGNLKMKINGPCNRCQMICIDQDTGEKSKEPLLTLASTRGHKIHFGIYLGIPRAENQSKKLGEKGLIEIGAPVIVS